MKISVITASYNAVGTIERTIYSVASQTYGDIQYIVIDGKSNDGTLDIIRKYTDFIDFYCSEKDKGIYDAFNKGLEHANGDYIIYIGADDWFTSDRVIESIVSDIMCHPSFDCYSYPIYKVDNSIGIQRKIIKKLSNDEIISGNMLPHNGMFVKTDVLKKFKFDMNYKIAADYDFLLKFIKNKYTIYYGDVVVTFFSIGGISSSEENELLFDREYKQIIANNGYSAEKVCKTHGTIRIRRNILRIRKAMSKTWLLKKMLLLKGWEIHKCNNPKCFLCFNKNEV